MRRVWAILVCTGILAFAGAGTAQAHGPQWGPRGFYGYGPPRAAWNVGYRGGFGGPCGAPRAVVAYPGYPAYPVYGGPVYGPAYPQLGFGVAGRNFSFFVGR